MAHMWVTVIYLIINHINLYDCKNDINKNY